MSHRVRDITSGLEDVGIQAKERFGALSAEQLNWKPAPKSWSVAQCLDHLIQTQRLYFPLFERLAAGEKTPGIWERVSPFSGFFGRLLIRAVDPETSRKIKTTAKAEPSASELDGRIVESFVSHQVELSRHVQALPADLDATRTIITSPLLGLVTYSLDDAFTILLTHGQRHLGQAQRVTESEGFPATE